MIGMFLLGAFTASLLITIVSYIMVIGKDEEE